MKRTIIVILIIILTSRPVLFAFADVIPVEGQLPVDNESIDLIEALVEESAEMVEDPIESPVASTDDLEEEDTEEVEGDVAEIEAEEGLEVPIEDSMEVPIENSVEESMDESTEDLIDEVKYPLEGPVEGSIESPLENTVENMIEENPSESLIEESVEEATEAPTEVPAEDFAEDSAESSDENLPIIYPPLLITEVMIGSEVNPEKDFWIELYNPGVEPVSLADWQIKGVTKGDSWIKLVNDESVIEPGEFFLYSRYSNSSSSALAIKPHFTKSNLVLPDFSTINIQLKNPGDELVDIFQIDHQLAGAYRAYERVCLGEFFSDEFEKSDRHQNLKEEAIRTFGSPGVGCLPIEGSIEGPIDVPIEDPIDNYPDVEFINEVMVNPQGSDTEGEWVELYNNTTETLDLTNWYLDDDEGASKPFKIGRLLRPGDYAVLRNPDLGLSFKNTSDVVRLLDPNLNPKQVISYSDAKEDYSFAKDDVGYFKWTPRVTLGKLNDFPPPPKVYYFKNVVFQKIQPNPNGYDSGNEKILLTNHLNESVDLAGWKMVDQKGKAYTLPSVQIEALDELSFNPAAIKLSLPNSEGELKLYDAKNNLIHDIKWEKSISGQWVYPSGYFPEGIGVSVIRAVDGDTLLVDFDDQEWKLRLIGIDAPETVHPKKEVQFYGKEAHQYLTQLVAGRLVNLKFDESLMDAYGRLLAYVYLDGELVNASMLKEGYAKLYVEFPFKKLDEFRTYEIEGKEHQRGLWKKSDIENSDEGPIGQSDLQEEEIEDSIEGLIKPAAKDLVEISMMEVIEDSIEEPEIVCPNEGLKIQSILPNDEKGSTIEYIQLINTTELPICLNGWSLDDIQDRGSKPYSLKEGSIEANSVHTFDKKLTKISLNNSDDCASLVNPEGKLVDQICYQKTTKNQVITHDTPLSQPAAKKSSGSSASSAKKISFHREAINYQWELKDQTLEGEVAFVYPEGEVFYLKKEDQIYPVSYANSNIDFSIAKQMLHEGESVRLAVRSNPTENQLVGIESVVQVVANTDEPSASFAAELKYLFLLVCFLICGFGVKKMRSLC